MLGNYSYSEISPGIVGQCVVTVPKNFMNVEFMKQVPLFISMNYGNPFLCTALSTIKCLALHTHIKLTSFTFELKIKVILVVWCSTLSFWGNHSYCAFPLIVCIQLWIIKRFSGQHFSLRTTKIVQTIIAAFAVCVELCFHDRLSLVFFFFFFE